MDGERGEGFDVRETNRRTDDEEEAALQQDSTQRACNDSLYFSNADFFTQHVGDHWGGGSVQDKKKVKTKHNSDHIQTMAFPPTTVSQRQC